MHPGKLNVEKWKVMKRAVTEMGLAMHSGFVFDPSKEMFNIICKADYKILDLDKGFELSKFPAMEEFLNERSKR